MDRMEKAYTRMERLVWDMHQIVLDLESIPGALLPNHPTEESSSSVDPPPRNTTTTTPAQHRRVLRRLDRCLQQLESEMVPLLRVERERHQRDNDDNPNNDTSQPEISHISTTSSAAAATTTFLLQEEILSLSSQQRTTTPDVQPMIMTIMTPHSETSAIVDTDIQQQKQQTRNHPLFWESPSIISMFENLVVDLRTLLTRLSVEGMYELGPKNHPPLPNGREETIPPSFTASIVSCIARLWQQIPHNHSSFLSSTEIQILLERLLSFSGNGCCWSNPNPLASDNHLNPVACTILSAWLHVLIHQFQYMHHHHQNNHSDPHPTETITDEGTKVATRNESTLPEPPRQRLQGVVKHPHFVVTIVPAFVRTAQETIHLKPWEPHGIVDAYTEMATQWRILTGYLIETIILVQQYHPQEQPEQEIGNADWNSDKQHTPNRTIQEWIVDSFRQVHSTMSLPQIEQMCMQEFWSLLHSYAQELTEYALDALDGAAVAFHSSVSYDSSRRPSPKKSSLVTHYLEQHDESQDSNPKKTNRHIPWTNNQQEPSLQFQWNATPSYPQHHHTEANGATQDMETRESMLVSTERAIRDSLRHVELAMNLLAVMHHVCSIPKVTNISMGEKQWMPEQWILSVNLWKTLSTSFLAKSNLTTPLNYTNKGATNNGAGDLWGQICNLQMDLADFVLSTEPQPENFENTACVPGNTGGYEKALALTFLRLLECPEQLLSSSVECLWRRLEQLLVEQPLTIATKDLKRILQVTVLTLRRQYSLPVSRIDALAAGSHPQRAAQTVVDRLLPILLNKPINPYNHQANRDGQAMVAMELWDNYFQQKVGNLLRV